MSGSGLESGSDSAAVSGSGVELVERSSQICANVGVLGHVDCGKTSLCKALSTTASTAAFDSNPQSKARKITLDLGFSAFSLQDKYNITLVDCPGHASLIRTVLGGVQIMDLMILVVDVNKGMQAQTWECLILADITPCHLIIALNKVDLLPVEGRQEKLEKFRTLMKKTLQKTRFGDSPMVETSSSAADGSVGTGQLKEAILKILNATEFYRCVHSPFLMAVDHSFSIKGAGTICTGTILEGHVKLNDYVNFPELQTTRKVKTMQIFKQSVDHASAGDRVALGIPGFDSKSMERGIICAPGLIPLASRAAIVRVHRIPFYKDPIKSGKQYHFSIGYSTVTASVQFFRQDSTAKDYRFDEFFNRSKDYLVQDILEITKPNGQPSIDFALLDFDKPVFILPTTLIIASNLQKQDETVACRLAFHGRVVESSQDKDCKKTYFPTLNLFYYKKKSGTVDRVSSSDTLIVRGFCQKASNIDHLIGLKVSVYGKQTSGEEKCLVKGQIEGRFGQTNKLRVSLDYAVSEHLQTFMKSNTCSVELIYKQYKYKTKAESGRKLCQ